jgi:hypothetical protein
MYNEFGVGTTLSSTFAVTTRGKQVSAERVRVAYCIITISIDTNDR